MVCCKLGERMLRGMKFKVIIAGIGLKEVEAEEIDGAYVAAIKQFGCRLEDILAVGPCVTVGEYLKQAKGKSDA